MQEYQPTEKKTIFDDRTFHHENKYFRENFEEYVKDTVEDELADAAIRLLDLAGANNLNLNRFCLQHVVTPKKKFYRKYICYRKRFGEL